MNVLWALSEIRTPFLDKVFQLITFLGEELFLIAVICALYWCIDKKLATQIGFTYICAGLCVQSLKITFRIPRPWVVDSNFKAVESAVPAATGYSFPSGHTQGAASMFGPLAFHFKKWYVKSACVLTFLLIGFSRMYLGCHTPKDVLVSLILSLIFAWIIWIYQDIFTNQPRFVGIISFVTALAAILVCAQSFFLYQSGIIETIYVSDCFKASGAALGFSIGWYLEKKYLNFSTDTFEKPVKLFIRFLVGLSVTALLKFGLKALLGQTLPGEMFAYALIIFWIIYLYPYLFSKFQKSHIDY